MNWEEIGEIKASKSKEQALRLLKDGFFTPKEISLRLDIHLSTVSRTLKALEQRGYVKCVNPQRRKGKLFTLMEKGSLLLERIDSLNKVEDK